MKIIISDIIKEQRKRLGINQETLANQFGISIQAVSKWEKGVSCPDISLLPGLAEFFGVTIDYLLTGKQIVVPESDDGEDEASPAAVYTVAGDGEIKEKCPKIDTLYVAQIYNGHIIEASNNFDDVDSVRLSVPAGTWNIDINCAASLSFDLFKGNVNVNGGNVSFNGEIVGPINAENTNFSCNDRVDGNVTMKSSSAGFNGDISGDVNVMTGDVSCENINGNLLHQNGDITVKGEVSGDIAHSRGNLNCEGDINGDVELADGNVNVEGDVAGDVDVHYGNLTCEGDLAGDVEVHDGDFSCEGDVAGDVKVTNGDFHCEGDVSGSVNEDDDDDEDEDDEDDHKEKHENNGHSYIKINRSSSDVNGHSENKISEIISSELHINTVHEEEAADNCGVVSIRKNSEGKYIVLFERLPAPEVSYDVFGNDQYGINVIYQHSSVRKSSVLLLLGEAEYELILKKDPKRPYSIDTIEYEETDDSFIFKHERCDSTSVTVSY